MEMGYGKRYGFSRFDGTIKNENVSQWTLKPATLECTTIDWVSRRLG